MGLEELADDIKLFVDAIGLKTFHIGGWSTGGAIVFDFATKYPEYVDKVIHICSVGPKGYTFHKFDEKGMPTAEKATNLKDVSALLAKIGEADHLSFIFNHFVWNVVLPSKEEHDLWIKEA